MSSFGVMKRDDVAGAGSADQLRREASKARNLADNAFGEDERRRLLEVAASLDREAVAMEAAIAMRVSRPAAFQTEPVVASTRRPRD